jgi:UDP-N-acetylmuramate dehydrogenase
MCGLKGKRIGDACISSKHANFIINRGRAKARDVLRLMGYIKRKVRDKFSIELEPEIRIWQN